MLLIDGLKLMQEKTGYLLPTNGYRIFVTCNGGVAFWLYGPFGFYI